MKYIFLTQQFFDDYAGCIEIEQKADRPYVLLLVSMDGVDFAIPFRSNIKHSHVFWTDKTRKCGLDYSKAVVIENHKYIDAERKPHIRECEHRALLGKEHEVRRGLSNYIAKYKSAKANPNKHSKVTLCIYSALQYFEKYF